MGNFFGKIVEAIVATEESQASDVGPSLKRLRLLSNLTQNEMAHRLDVQRGVISKIERGEDVQLPTIRKYVEALGASLRIEASFPANAPLALSIREAFDVELGNDDQMVLPLLGNDSFRAPRDVVLSIRPKYTDKILQGSKTVELRRRFPVSAPRGTIAYIYATSPVRAIVGVAEIRDVLKLPIEQIWTEFGDTASIERLEFEKYFDGLELGYVLVFEEVRTFCEPIPLTELRERFGFEPPQSYFYAKRDLRRALRDEFAVLPH